MADPSGRPQSSGVARRRRERRLRSMLRHERMTVAMALAEFSHHSSRGQRMARAGVWGHEQYYTAKIRKPPTPQPELFSLEEEPGGGLPAPLSEVAGRQEKVVRHVLEDLGSVCPFVQILDLPVPHRMDHLAELLNLEEDVLDAGRLVDRFFQVPELVIEVPKISLDVIPLRALVPEPQLAEQLVEVPTIVSFSSLHRIMEQTVDIPVPQGGGDVGPVTYNALRSQKTARAEATNNAPRSQMSSVAGDTELFSLYEDELGGTRPDRLYEVRPQERDQRHTVEQIVDSPQVVPSLDVPVPQRENQLVEACRHLDLPIPEQVIEVPKISSTPRPPRRRRVRFAEQTAEQLVEVPTIISYSSLRGIMEQNVDIPVPHGRGGRVGVRSLQGFPGQSSTAYCGADFPAATAEQNVDIPVPRGDRTLLPASSSAVLPVTANQGVFRTFPQNKKSAELGSHSGSELLPESRPIHASCSAEGGDGGLVRYPAAAQDAGAIGPAS